MNLKKKLKNKIIGLIKRGNWFNNILFPGCRKFWNYNTFNTDVINLGSTSAMNAFSYEGLQIKGANFAIGANPLLGDFEILKNYISYLKPNGYVIISLCPFSSLAGSYNTFDNRYYSILYPSSIPNYSYKTQCNVKDMIAHPYMYYPLYHIIKDVVHLLKREKITVRSEEWMKKDADKWMQSWMFEFSINAFSDPLSLKNKDGIDDAAYILNKMITFCREHSIRPVLVIPPIYHTLSQKFTPEVRRVIIDSLIDKIIDKEVPYLNYMDDVEFTNDETLFQNSFLMSKKGSVLFTKRLLNDIMMRRDSDS